MIVGGPRDGDSHRARKALLRNIRARNEHEVQEVGDIPKYPDVHFRLEDEEEILKARNDALVIIAEISG
ncbi:hypothetical protein ACS0TY_017802 [Phlomoides rotata]